jgi:lipoprotein signal peptidase
LAFLAPVLFLTFFVLFDNSLVWSLAVALLMGAAGSLGNYVRWRVRQNT